MNPQEKLLHPDLKSRYRLVAFIGYLSTSKWGGRLINGVIGLLKGRNISGLDCTEKFIPSKSGGPEIRIRIYKPLKYQGALPGMLFYHGGGYMIGNPEMSFENIKKFIKTRPCIIIAPDYRKSVNDPFPAGFNDCFDSLLWAKENAGELGMLANQFILAGPSAGGGLTAAVALKARDTKDVNVAFQMPLFPMIDDRQESESARTMTLYPWNAAKNKVGWELYLRDLVKNGDNIPEYAAPSRASDYKALPPTITFVGDIDPFRDETIAYVEALRESGVPVEFELYKGCYHGFQEFDPEASISKAALEFLYTAYAKYYDNSFIK